METMDLIEKWLETGKGIVRVLDPGDWISVAVLVLLFMMWIRLNRVTRQSKVARELIQSMTALQSEMNSVRDGLIGLGQEMRDSRGAPAPARPEVLQQK